MTNLINLQQFAESSGSFSQSGEERIVREFLRHAYSDSTQKITACEFGAHDGSNSNFLELCLSGAINGVFIECDSRRYSEFRRRYGSLENVKLIHERVGWSSESNLTSILSRHAIERSSVRFLSIDIDGDDIHVLSSIHDEFDLVIVEYNPTFANDVEFTNPIGLSYGSSPSAIIKVAKQKNMLLAAITETNLIFIGAKFYGTFRTYNLWELEISPYSIRFGLAYDGTIVRMSASGKNITAEVMSGGWGDALYLQPLPRFLRKFGKRSRLRFIYSCLVVLILRPVLIPGIFRRKNELSKE